MEILISFIIPFIILLTVVVFIHEYGHYYYAKKYGGKKYLEAKKEAKETFTLTKNYRSSKELIDIINCLYKEGLKESNLNYVELSSGSKENQKINIHKNKVFEIINYSNKEIIEEKVITVLIQILINQRSIPLNKIAIITSYNYQCELFKNILLKNNLPSQIVNKLNIFDTESAKLLIFLIEVLRNPSSTRNMILLSTSKLIQINKNELENTENSKTLKKISKNIKSWKDQLRKIGFLTLLNKLIIDLLLQFLHFFIYKDIIILFRTSL